MSMDTQRLSDETLSAWLDGELDETRRQEIEAWLHDHPEDAARVRLWAADREALRARFGPVLHEAVPEALQRTVNDYGRGSTTDPRGWARWKVAAAAAGLLIAGSIIGGGLVWQLQPQQQIASRSTWTQRAAVAHAVYAPEVRHPVEVNVAEGLPEQQHAQEEHLARWLTKRLDMPVRLFDMREHGFSLVGGRLLPDAQGPSAQLMYQNAGGQRVTVYLRRPEPGSSTSFRFQREGELSMFYWAEEGFGCALVGKLPREKLLAMAESAYKQVEQDLPAARARPSS